MVLCNFNQHLFPFVSVPLFLMLLDNNGDSPSITVLGKKNTVHYCFIISQIVQRKMEEEDEEGGRCFLTAVCSVGG